MPVLQEWVFTCSKDKDFRGNTEKTLQLCPQWFLPGILYDMNGPYSVSTFFILVFT